MGLAANSPSNQNSSSTQKEKTKKKEKNQAEQIHIKNEEQGNSSDSREDASSEKKVDQESVLKLNEKLIQAYFNYDQASDRIDHLLPLVTDDFKQKIEEAAGSADGKMKSRVVQQSSFVNMDSYFHPQIVNVVTYQLTVNGKSYKQSNYIRFTFDNVNNEWKMAEMALTPIGGTVKD
ncbi:hypothetical protein ACYRFS_12835 [Listeria kieliensis]